MKEKTKDEIAAAKGRAILAWLFKIGLVFCGLAAVKDGITWMRTEPRYALFLSPPLSSPPHPRRLKSFDSLNELEREAIALIALNATRLDIAGDAVFLTLPWSAEAEARYSLEWTNKSISAGLVAFDANYVLNLFEKSMSFPKLVVWIMLAPVKVMLWPLRDHVLSANERDELAFFACTFKHMVPVLIRMFRENKTEL